MNLFTPAHPSIAKTGRTLRTAAARGQAMVETIGAIIVLMILFLLITSFMLLLYMQTTVFSAAREGARAAAVNVDMVTNPSAAQAEVVTQVQNFFTQTTGQTLNASDITVTGPTGATTGRRNVQVTVTYAMPNPLGIGDWLDAMGADGDPFKSFTLAATANMRYEE